MLSKNIYGNNGNVWVTIVSWIDNGFDEIVPIATGGIRFTIGVGGGIKGALLMYWVSITSTDEWYLYIIPIEASIDEIVQDWSFWRIEFKPLRTCNYGLIYSDGWNSIYAPSAILIP